MKLLIIIYIIPISFSLIVGLIKLKKLSSLLKNVPKEEWLDYFNEKFESSSKYEKPISELEETPVIVVSFFKKILYILSFAFLFPVTMFRLSLAAAFGIKILWRLPFQVYEVWSLAFLGVSFYFTQNGSIFLSYSISVAICLIYISMIAEDFSTKNGVLKLSKTAKHKLRIAHPLVNGFIVSACFSSIYFNLSMTNSSYFSEKLSVFSSFYFSIITVCTIGYGDVVATHWISRSIVITQVILGYIYTVMLVGIFVSIWVNKFNESGNEQNT